MFDHFVLHFSNRGIQDFRDGSSRRKYTDRTIVVARQLERSLTKASSTLPGIDGRTDRSRRRQRRRFN